MGVRRTLPIVPTTAPPLSGIRRAPWRRGVGVQVMTNTGYPITTLPFGNTATGSPMPSPAVDSANPGELPGSAKPRHAKISFERYKTTMQSSFMRRFERGAHVFRRGDPVDHFYVITRGQVEVLVPAAAAAKATLQGGGGGATEAKLPHGKSAAAEKHLVATPSTVPGTDLYPDERPGAAPTGPGTGSGKARPEGEVVIATLGPGDFFGETGLLEGRQKRGASVLCTSDVEVGCLGASPRTSSASSHACIGSRAAGGAGDACACARAVPAAVRARSLLRPLRVDSRWAHAGRCARGAGDVRAGDGHG